MKTSFRIRLFGLRAPETILKSTCRPEFPNVQKPFARVCQTRQGGAWGEPSWGTLGGLAGPASDLGACEASASRRPAERYRTRWRQASATGWAECGSPQRSTHLASLEGTGVAPRGLEPRTVRSLAARPNQLGYEISCFFFGGGRRPWYLYDARLAASASEYTAPPAGHEF